MFFGPRPAPDITECACYTSQIRFFKRRPGMKQLLAVATFAVLVVGLAYAQTRSKKQPTVPIARRLAMNIGVVPVWLGMPQKQVEDELTKVGYTLIPSGDEPLVFENAGKTDARGIGQLVFRKGRLFHASRDWPSGEHSF